MRRSLPASVISRPAMSLSKVGSVLLVTLLLISDVQHVFCFTRKQTTINNPALTVMGSRNNMHHTIVNSSNKMEDIHMFGTYNSGKSVDSWIKSELTELNALNYTNYRLLSNFQNALCLFTGSFNENVGQVAIDIVEEIEQSLRDFNNTLSSLVEFFKTHNLSLQDEDKQIYVRELETYKKCVNDLNIVPNSLDRFKLIYNLTVQIHEIDNLHYETNHIDNYCNPCTYYNIKDILMHRKNVKRLIDDFLDHAEYLLTSTNGTRSDEVSETILKFSPVNLDELINALRIRTEKINSMKKLYEEHINQDNIVSVFYEYVHPFIQCIIFVFGFVGNTLLLIIFAKHKEVRNRQNLMLINLAFVDNFNLIVYMCHMYVSFTSETNHSLCIIFRFFVQFFTCVSVYSVVVISFQRFLNVSGSSEQSFCTYKVMKNVTYFLLPLVWVISVAIAVVETVYARVYYNCNESSRVNNLHYSMNVKIFKFLAICVVPFILIVILSILSAKQLKESVRNIGEIRPGVDRIIHSRIIGYRIILFLTVAFAISYVPFFSFSFLKSSVNVQPEGTLSYIVVLLTYSLVFCNACFNPVAIYMGSQTFRTYFQKYLPCQKKNNAEDSSSPNSTAMIIRV